MKPLPREGTVEVMMRGNAQAPDLAPDRHRLELTRLKPVIDCLDQHLR
ncbi:MAG: hypothetical protein ABSF95_14875 [Verrucomicrobiota bacterium]